MRHQPRSQGSLLPVPAKREREGRVGEDPGNEVGASPVWNFCARFLDVISRETSGGVVKCRLFSQSSVSILMDQLSNIESLA